MKMRRSIHLLLFLLLTLQAWAVPINQMTGKHIRFYKPSEYNSDAQVWAISRGENDDMYFATNEGILLHDGVRWEKYLTPTECIMRSVFYDTDEKKAYSGGVNEFGYWKYDEYGNLQYTSLYQNPKNEPTKEFWKIAKVPYSHLIYFQSPVSLLVYNTQTETVIEIPSDGKRFNSLSLVNRILFVQQEDKLFRLDGEKKVLVTEQLTDFYVIGMFPEPDGAVRLVNSERGSLVIDHSGKVERKLPAFADVRITSVCRMEDKYLVGTGNSGFFQIDGDSQILSQVSERQGLKSVVLSVGFSNRGDIWLGLNGGIMFIEESVKEEAFLMDPQEKIGYVYCAANRPECLYVGTNKGLYAAKPTLDGAADFQFVSSLKGQVWNLYDVNGELLVAHDKGLFRLRHGNLEEIRHGGVYTFQPIPMHPGWYISGNYNGFSVYHSADGVLNYRNDIRGYTNLVQDCAFDKEGNLWVIHSRTELMRIRLDKSCSQVQESEIYELPAVPTQKVRAVMCPIDQELVFLDNEGHAYKYNELKNNLQPDEYYTSLLKPINQGALSVQYSGDMYWQVSQEGVSFLRKDYNKIALYSRLFTNVSDNFTPKGFRKMMRISEKSYAVGLLNGMGIIDTDKMGQQLIRVPHVRKMEAVGEAGSLLLAAEKGNKWTVPPHVNNVVLWLTSLDRDGQVEYRISERGRDWEVIYDGMIHLTYLAPGDYTVEIRGSNGYGGYSEAEVHRIHVDAPWYATVYAFALYALLLLGAGYGIRRTYKYKTRKHEREIKAEEERKRIEELSLFQLNGLKEELENKNSKLMSITMLGVQNNTFLKKTREEISELLGEEATSAQKMQIRRIMKEIDRQLSDQTGWNNFAEHFNNTCNGFFDRLNEQHSKLTNNDLRLCAYIRMNLSAKEIASLMNISTNSVEMAKYRLRKKLDLDESVTLNQYLSEVIATLENFGNTIC